MQALRPVLLRRVQRAVTKDKLSQLSRSGSLNSWRAQHDHHGPHKEYFQTPGQMPVPDSTPYTHGQPYIPSIQNVPPTSRTGGISLLRSFSRSVFWAVLFASLGVTAGTALITWEYLQPPFEPGSPAEQELYDEILDAMELHPLVDSLRQANWIEENYYAAHSGAGNELENRGLHLVAETLQGTQGVSVKTFKHPTQEFTIMVCFLGFGIEGWPDTIHGGMIVTLIEEGIQRQIHNFYKKFGSRDQQTISIDFKRPMRPGEIYAVIVPPAQLESNPAPETTHLQILPMVVRIEAPPRITPELLTIELPSIDELHAVANVQVRLVQSKSEEGMAEPEGHVASKKID
ncbi:uncharacterized protein PV07_06721 [Cladophialophora immunda]|uniref:Thioesterase domain-containing protein n=1 Tax=Cladophialophora immunda TaxID=569365 RepID=A0A0D2C728_9EURO|nr:uncharacterized protein PV07_06721 [Cladophialophora immunda]KIW26933.1 hypothetical protein PV07_06721 [Cladophialophora immunda]OQV03920.1 hypothetical protein CLAIMM_08892 [Cladophialophora immunda]